MAKLDQITINGTTYEIVPEIAPLFDATKAYAVGDCVIKDAVLYRFTVAHAAGAWIGTDAEEVAVGEELTNLKTDLNKVDDVIGPDYHWSGYTIDSPDVSIINGYVRSPSQTYPGRIDASETKKCFYIQVLEDSFIYDVVGGQWSVIRISRNEPQIGSDDELGVHWASYTADAPLIVKAGLYITITSNAGIPKDTLYISPVAYGLKNEIYQTIHDDLFVEKTLNHFGNWVHGYWANVDDLRRSTKYIAACSTPITFTDDTLLISYGPNYIKGFINGASFNRTNAILIPKNAKAYLYLQQINEDTSITIDPVALASTVKVVNEYPYDDYNLHKDSFFGLGMFKKIGICGDSYSAIRLGYSWGQVVAGELGVNVFNFAKSGDDSYMWINDTDHGLPLVLSSDRCDLYWLALGINDSSRVLSNPSYLGSSDDLNGDDYTQYPDTFWGNQGKIIETIRAYAPKARLVMYKPIFGKVSTALGITDATNLPLIRNAIGEIADHYSIPVIDSLDDIFFRSPEYAKHMDYDISAGNHPSIMLYPGIAHANMRLFSRCVAKYDSYFMGIDYSS